MLPGRGKLLLQAIVLANGLAPIVWEGHGLVVDQVVEHHDGEAAAFHFLRIHVDDVLFQLETLVPNLRDSGSGGNVFASLDL